MGQVNISGRIRQHYKEIGRILPRLDGRFVEEDVHAFRVEVKKLRALLRLAASEHGSRRGLSLPARLREFYQLTGAVRNLQLQRKSLAEAAEVMHKQLPAGPAGLLDERIKAAIGAAQQFMDRGPVFEKKGRIFASLPKSIGMAGTKRFIHRKMKPCRSIRHRSALAFTSVLGEDSLHELRKSLKDLMYAWPCLSRSGRRQIRIGELSSRKDIAQLAEDLGEFRDRCICMSLFQDEDFLFFSGLPAKGFLQAAAEAWLCEKKGLLEKINKTLMSGKNLPAPVAYMKRIHAHMCQQ